MKVVLIYNSKSGSGYDLRSLRRIFRAADITIEYSFSTKQLNSTKLKDLIRRGRTIAVVGGDGTLNSVARLVVNTKSTMLPLPGGTFNHFVRDLGMPSDVETILASIKDAREQMIDVAYVNEELFLNNSNIGLYPFSLIERKSTKRLLGKHVAAVLSAFDQLSLFRRHRLIIDGKRIKSPFVFIGNNEYDIERSIIPQRTDFTKGQLTMMVATSNSRLKLLSSVYAVMKGNISDRDDFTVTQRPEVTIYSSERTIPVSYDGEVTKMTPPLAYHSAPRSLRVLVVRDAS